MSEFEACQSRAEARSKGSNKYFTGKPCKNGHLSLRSTMSGTCYACRVLWEENRARAEPGFESKNTIRYRNYRVTNAKHYWAKEVCNHAKRRAKKMNLPFDLTVPYIKAIAPTHCPVLGIELSYVRGDKTHARNNSPSLDRIYQNEGYTKENTIVVSYRANSIKQDATIDELVKVSRFYDAISPSVEEMRLIEHGHE